MVGSLLAFERERVSMGCRLAGRSWDVACEARMAGIWVDSGDGGVVRLRAENLDELGRK